MTKAWSRAGLRHREAFVDPRRRSQSGRGRQMSRPGSVTSISESPGDALSAQDTPDLAKDVRNVAGLEYQHLADAGVHEFNAVLLLEHDRVFDSEAPLEQSQVV